MPSKLAIGVRFPVGVQKMKRSTKKRPKHIRWDFNGDGRFKIDRGLTKSERRHFKKWFYKQLDKNE